MLAWGTVLDKDRDGDRPGLCNTFKVTRRFGFINVQFTFVSADSVWASMFSISVSMLDFLIDFVYIELNQLITVITTEATKKDLPKYVLRVVSAISHVR